MLGWCPISSRLHPVCLSSAWTRLLWRKPRWQSCLNMCHNYGSWTSSRQRYLCSTATSLIPASQEHPSVFWLSCNISSCWWTVLPGEGCVSFGTAVKPADSQSGWDRGDRKFSGAPCLPPSPVVSQSSRNPCSQWQWGPADHLRCVMEHFKMSKTKWFVWDKLFRGLCVLPRSEVDSADAARTALCDRQWVVVPV